MRAFVRRNPSCSKTEKRGFTEKLLSSAQLADSTTKFFLDSQKRRACAHRTPRTNSINAIARGARSTYALPIGIEERELSVFWQQLTVIGSRSCGLSDGFNVAVKRVIGLLVLGRGWRVYPSLDREPRPASLSKSSSLTLFTYSSLFP